MNLQDWYHVRLDIAGILLDVSPPNQGAWQAKIPWEDIIRVCFSAEDVLSSDAWYIFTRSRPESYAVPVEADGGDALLDEFLMRKLFNAELAIRAASAVDEVLCWPPV
ncbi:conserved hypothetical protein [Gammaproteobacteria bacterium]